MWPCHILTSQPQKWLLIHCKVHHISHIFRVIRSPISLQWTILERWVSVFASADKNRPSCCTSLAVTSALIQKQIFHFFCCKLYLLLWLNKAKFQPNMSKDKYISIGKPGVNILSKGNLWTKQSTFAFFHFLLLSVFLFFQVEKYRHCYLLLYKKYIQR